MLTPQALLELRKKALQAWHEAGAAAYADRLSKLTPEELGEEIVTKIAIHIPKVCAEGKPACIYYQVSKCELPVVCRNQKIIAGVIANSILSLLTSQIEQAVTKEQERILKLLYPDLICAPEDAEKK
jgi:excinuclease UvrABC nuclease subunit